MHSQMPWLLQVLGMADSGFFKQRESQDAQADPLDEKHYWKGEKPGP